MTRRAYIFVEALVLVAALVALLGMIAADTRVSTQEVQNRLRERRAAQAADAAVARALGVLQDTDPAVVTLNDEWATLGENGDDSFELANDQTFRLQIVDASSLVNVNTAPAAQLQKLPLEQDEVDALLDWRESGTTPRSDGAKDGYYNSLPQPYNAKLGALTTVNELLLVRDWTGQTLYQPPTLQTTTDLPTDEAGNVLPLAATLTVDSGAPNTGTGGGQPTNFSQGVDFPTLTHLGIDPGLAGTLAAHGPFQSFADLLSQPGMTPQAMQTLLNVASFTSGDRTQGKINLNTAPEAVLETVPNVTATMADAIVAQQADGFQSLGQLASISGVNAQNLPQIADAFTVGSDTWIVRAYGQSGGIGVPVEVVISVRNGGAQVISWERLNTPGIPGWWGWQRDASENEAAGGMG